ncbi:probable carbohydrate esterase At4g34215 [Humulus lupulus]|uniref:probable carbohydrate esterase At4g34215 n=1 Tax=Humulus lupulus TaxID=3486 RepID=UPI002B4160C5|nr:probable carbohydrate esterase At4g34215 [Humulus lupulus]
MAAPLFFWLFSLVSISNVAIGTSIPMDIFVLAGQSNMAGRGGVSHGVRDHYVPPKCSPNRQILRLSAKLEWESAHEPLHADIDTGNVCGVGPGMAFANEVVRARGGSVVVGLVPCAIGGTRISQWIRGTPLYSSLLRRAQESLKEGGTIRAVLWFQGESDTLRTSDAVAYGGNMKKFIMDIRSDLNIPNLLVIQVALASGEGQYIEEVRKAQLQLNLQNVKCVDAKGLNLKADKLHLTTTSHVHLGLKLANAFLAS